MCVIAIVLLLLPSDVSECCVRGTQQRSNLYQVPPNALGKETVKGAHWCFHCRELVQLALGKDEAFADCCVRGTRQPLPSAS
jgi:hypothetical protein